MKISNLLTILFTLSTSFIFGQSKFYQTNDGSILDSLTNEKRKAKIMQFAMNSTPNKEAIINLVENLKEIRRSQDSLIFSSEVQLHIDIDSRKIAESKLFKPKELIGQEFPLKNFISLDNVSISLDDLKGKPSLINFWYTSCRPCIDEMPVLNQIKSRLKDSVNFIAITYETNDKVKKFLLNHKFNFIQVPNSQNLVDILNINAFPVNIILDKNGIIRVIENGIPYVFNTSRNMKMSDGKGLISLLRDLY